MFFSDVVGQEELKKKIRISLKSGRIPHAQLFFGPSGSGNLPLAIAYAQYIACTGSKSDDSCGVCSSCQKFAKLIHPDLHFAFPVNTTGRIVKDAVSDDFIAEWRQFVLANPYFSQADWYNYISVENKQGIISKKEAELISQKLSLKPFESEYKFMIVWLPEKMNPSAANLLLKLIEEPPRHTYFLLVSNDPGQVLLTITSRTQPVKLSRIDAESMVEILKSKHGISQAEIPNLVRLANGNYVEALKIVNTTDENEFIFEKFKLVMRSCWSRDYVAINAWVEEIAQLGRERLKSFFDYASHLVRENFISHTGNPDLVYMTDDEMDFSRRFYSYINGNNVSKLYTELNSAAADIERNGYAKIVLFDFCLQIVKLIRK